MRLLNTGRPATRQVSSWGLTNDIHEPCHALQLNLPYATASLLVTRSKSSCLAISSWHPLSALFLTSLEAGDICKLFRLFLMGRSFDLINARWARIRSEQD